MIEEILAAQEENLDPTGCLRFVFLTMGAGDEPLEQHPGAK